MRAYFASSLKPLKTAGVAALAALAPVGRKQTLGTHRARAAPLTARRAPCLPPCQNEFRQSLKRATERRRTLREQRASGRSSGRITPIGEAKPQSVGSVARMSLAHWSSADESSRPHPARAVPVDKSVDGLPVLAAVVPPSDEHRVEEVPRVKDVDELLEKR